jgi:hypothetical protein
MTTKRLITILITSCIAGRFIYCVLRDWHKVWKSRHGGK